MVSRQYLLRQNCSKHLDEGLKRNILFSKLVNADIFLGLLVTKDDQVYALGADTNNYFGLGPVTEIPRLTKIESLCGKTICQFATYSSESVGFVLALSVSGVVYAWGVNSYGQLGNGSKTNSTVPVIVAGDLHDKVVKKVVCGSHMSVALTEEGEVFTWGCNRYGRTGHGIDSESGTLTPRIVGGLLADEFITNISCNLGSVFCLNREGKLFAFGYNCYGNLGIGNTTHQLTPALVIVPDGHKIQNISCGKRHTLALTDQGMLLTWGKNSNGQLGIGNTTQSNSPTPVNLNVSENTGKCEVIEIMAEGDTSFAMDTARTVYVWGSVDGQDVFLPRMSDSAFPDTSNECRVSSASNSESHGFVVVDLLKSFDNRATSDFVVAVEGKDIQVHKAILRIRSPYFETMFNNDWKETGTNKIVIEHHSYDVYREFLRYIYCGEVRNLPPEQSMRLLDLATMVLDDRLAELCYKNIRESLTVENLLEVFSLSLTFNREELVDDCVRWAASKGLKKVLESKAFKEISLEHSREFILKGLVHGAFDRLI